MAGRIGGGPSQLDIGVIRIVANVAEWDIMAGSFIGNPSQSAAGVIRIVANVADWDIVAIRIGRNVPERCERRTYRKSEKNTGDTVKSLTF